MSSIGPAWKEVIVRVPTPAPKTGGTKRKDTRDTYYYERTSSAQPPVVASSSSHVGPPEYVPIYLPKAKSTSGQPSTTKNGMYFIGMVQFNQYRQVETKGPKLPWGSEGLGFLSVCNKDGIGEQLESESFLPKGQGPYYTDYFQQLFVESQKKAAQLVNDSDYPGWTKVEGWAWKTTDDVAPLTDGIGFNLRTHGAGSLGPTARYVKLRTFTTSKAAPEATSLVQGDQIAQKRGVVADGVYIEESKMQSLAAGTYPWDSVSNRVDIRQADGSPEYLTVDNRALRTADYWKKAFKNCTETREYRPDRARNPQKPKLLFVVQPNNRGVDDNLLTTLYNQVISQSESGIYQTAEIIRHSEYEKLKTKYPIPLGTSPFGDYHTYVSMADFVSFLQAYPGYDLPASADNVKAGFRQLKPTAARENFNQDAAKKVAKAVEEAKAKMKQGLPVNPTTSLGEVSYSTIAFARGKRDNFPNQSAVMGGSATEVALALEWPKDSDTAETVTMGNIVWDGPGLQRAEWLHRSAFSWGSTLGLEHIQISSNLIFGSSETNSVMTRYEKSWQALFQVERSLQKDVAEHLRESGVAEAEVDTKAAQLVPLSVGWLITENTSKKAPIEIFSIKGEKEKVAEITSHQYEEPPSPKQGAPSLTLWDWPLQDGLSNLSFVLSYNLKIPKTNPLGLPLVSMGTQFWAFQRSFFTNLESSVDIALLEYWKGLKLAEIKKTLDTAGSGSKLALHQAAMMKKASEPLTLNVLATRILNKRAETSASAPAIPKLAPPQNSLKAIWEAAKKGHPCQSLGIQLESTSIVAADKYGQAVYIRAVIPSTSMGDEAQRVSVSTPTVLPSFQSSGLRKAPQSVISTLQKASVGLVDAPVPPGFVLNGKIKLFGVFPATMYAFHGTVSQGVRQIVPLESKQLTISDIITSLKGSEIDGIVLENTQFAYNELDADTYQSGLWLQTDIVFSGPLQSISDTLKNIFHQQNPSLTVQGLLSITNDWIHPFIPSSFCLSGSFQNISVKLGDIVEFTSLGIGLDVGRQQDLFSPNKEVYDWGVTFFGNLNFHTSTEGTPLVLDYSLSNLGGVVTISMRTRAEDPVQNFCGVAGLQLSVANFTATFAPGSAPSQLTLNASATILLQESSLSLSGYYSKDDWAFMCEMDDFSLTDLGSLYEDLFFSSLHIPDYDVEFDSLVFLAGSSGIQLSCAVTIGEYSSAQAVVSLSNLGVSVSGSVDDIPLTGDITLTNASLDIFLGRTSDTTLNGAGTSFRFAISGTVTVEGNDISASLFLGKDAKGNPIWTVYGKWAGTVKLSALASPLKGTFLDLELDEVAFIASNVDGQAVAGANVPVSFPIVKGVQVAARLGSLPWLDKAMNNSASSSGLTVQAIYNTTSSSFEVGILLSTPQTMSMRSGSVSSGPISLDILISMQPQLVLTADFFVKVPNQATPLKFSGGFKISELEADLFIELKNQFWVDPFNLSPQLQLGPNIALEVGIVLGSPIYPSKLGVEAGMVVGSISGQAALSISDDPMDELIFMKVDNLSVADLVSFASTIFQTSIPQPPSFINFKEVELYLSTGATIGTTVYPPGASFTCDVVLFGTGASIYCAVDKTTQLIEIKGSVSPIDIGPIVVRGTTPGTPAKVDIEMGKAAQTVFIDGIFQISSFNLEAFVNVTLLPTPSFDVKSSFVFVPHLQFDVEFIMQGGSFKNILDLSSLDFEIQATLTADILNYIAEQVNGQIVSAKHAVDDGIAQAQQTLDEAEAHFTEDVATAEAAVKSAQAKFDTRMKAATAALSSETAKQQLRISQLQQDVKNAQSSQDHAVLVANGNLAAANRRETEALQAAQQNVDSVRRAGDQSVDAQIQKLASAKQSMQSQFGDAINKIQSAQDQVHSAQRAVDSAQNDLNNAENESVPWTEPWKAAQKTYDITQAGIRLAAAKAGLATANGLLEAAKAVVETPGYLAAQAAITTAQTSLSVAKQAADTNLSLANAALQQTQTTQAALVSAAQQAVTATSQGVEAAALNSAKLALQTYSDAEAKVIAGLNAAIQAVKTGLEAAALSSAQAALQEAQQNARDIDVARQALNAAQGAAGSVTQAADWITRHSTDILDVRKVEIEADLRGVVEKGIKLTANVSATFASKDVEFSIDLKIGDGDQFVKDIFNKFMGDIKSGAFTVPSL
ncbi:hypothetical protein PSPO01_15541 [Paraphaeosphaeria sporulosa]